LYLNSIEVDKVGEEGELIIAEIDVSREGDLLVDHIEPIMSRGILVKCISATK
jgi:hypothetical protein